MPDYRLSFIFEAGRQGWSEQWYMAASNATTAIQRGTDPAFLSGFLSPRAGGVYLTGLRVNNVIDKRDTQLAITNMNASQFNPGAANYGEEAAVAALGYAKTTTGRHRSVMVRGLIDTQVTRDANDQVIWSANFAAALFRYRDALIAQNMRVKVSVPPNNDNPERQVTEMLPNPNNSNLTRFVYNDVTLLSDGIPVLLHKLPRSRFPGYGGPLPSLNVTATTVDVPVPWRQPAPSVPLGNTTIMHIDWSYELLGGIAWIDMRTKRVGRPSFVARGRRSGIKYRSQ